MWQLITVPAREITVFRSSVHANLSGIESTWMWRKGALWILLELVDAFVLLLPHGSWSPPCCLGLHCAHLFLYKIIFFLRVLDYGGAIIYHCRKHWPRCTEDPKEILCVAVRKIMELLGASYLQIPEKSAHTPKTMKSCLLLSPLVEVSSTWERKTGFPETTDSCQIKCLK